MAEKGEKKHRKHLATQTGKKENPAAETKERSRSNDGALREPWQMEDTRGDEVSVPAIHHVGPTLESDPEFRGLSSSRPTPEEIIANIGAPLPGEGIDRDIDAQPELENRTARGERLRTHLAGDTSSDPHTDLGPKGPDNASTAQHQGKRKRHAA
jgi:hypothetical protein